MAASHETAVVVARPYQLELLDAALDENTIVLLGTGAGKTFIAVLLIKQLAHSILGGFFSSTAASNGSTATAKRTIFLVNTVPLVTQQASYIQAHTPFNIGSFCGEMGVDSWGQQKWNDQLEKHHVLVMTRQIFLDMLNHGFVSIDRVNLLIFDECHHAVKNDPYVGIMRFFNRVPVINRPRILGLSASIISGKCKPFQLKEKLKQLETTLSSRVATARDLAEVAKYATNPNESLICYSSHPISSREHLYSLKLILSKVLEFLYLSIKPKTKNTVAGKLKEYLEESVYTLENVSVSSAVKASQLMKVHVKDILDNVPSLSAWEKKLCELTLQKLSEFASECNQSLAKGGFDDYSPKLSKMLEVLTQLHSAISLSEEKLCGLIFVEQRSTAICLSELLQSLEEEQLLTHIKCDYIIGHSPNNSRDGMNVKKQQSVLKKFRSGATNLLIATSVVEEGLDVPKCNLVLRYDFPKTFQSHVQSKGRARAKNSWYLLLVHENEFQKKRGDLNQYVELERALSELCHDREPPSNDEVERRLRDLIQPYQPFGPSGPSIAVTDSLSLLHRYCQKLPSDRYVILSPDFEVETVENKVCVLDSCHYDNLYIVTVHLPMSSPVKSVQGQPLPYVDLAKKSAAFNAIQKLHEVGELDDHLKPISHEEIDSDEEDEEKMTAKDTKHAGTQRKISYYRNRVPLCLQAVNPKPDVKNHLYVFLVKDKITGMYYQMKEDGQVTLTTLGLLTSKPIPSAKVPPFSLYIDNTEVTVSIQEQEINLTHFELELFQEFHKCLFTDILAMKGFVMSFEGQIRNYLIIPVTVAIGFEPITCFIDTETIRETVTAVKEKVTPLLSLPGLNWLDKLVLKSYTEEMVHSQPQLYEVVSINTKETPLSQFPADPSITYKQYFSDKYGYTFNNHNQPSLTCSPVSMGANSLKLLSSRFKKSDSISRRTKDITLFPELCRVWPVPASLWRYCRLVPSILYRIEAILSISELSDIISTSTGIGEVGDYDYSLHSELSSDEAITDTSKCIVYCRNDETISVVDQYSNTTIEVLVRPSNALLLQAMTATSANDSFDLERLETLGDSFLKLLTSVSLFCCRDDQHEGKLTCARERRISNFNLSYLAKRKELPQWIYSQPFEPLNRWIPPNFTLPDVNLEGPLAVILSESQVPERVLYFCYHKTNDKGIADCVEALIGAYLISGGIEAGLKFLDWLGIKCSSSAGNHDIEMNSLSSSRSQSQSSLMSIDETETASDNCIGHKLLLRNSSQIFQFHFCTPTTLLPPIVKDDSVNEIISRMIAPCLSNPSETNHTSLCEKIQWTFSNQALLLEALTHPSYTKNRLTHSYQRLEFLGDAVLDYLITCCLYSEFPHYTPGEITATRSALVNNITFAEISVKELSLHSYLLHLSPALFAQITEYVEHLNSQEADTNESEVYCQCNQTNDSRASVTAELDETVAGDNEDNEDDIEELEPPKALGDVLESLAGALFLDSGMSLEIVWSRFYPFFKPMIDKFRDAGPPVHPIQELFQICNVEMNQSKFERSKHRCTIKVVDKEIQVSCVAKTYKAAKYGAAKRVISILKS